MRWVRGVKEANGPPLRPSQNLRTPLPAHSGARAGWSRGARWASVVESAEDGGGGAALLDLGGAGGEELFEFGDGEAAGVVVLVLGEPGGDVGAGGPGVEGEQVRRDS